MQHYGPTMKLAIVATLFWTAAFTALGIDIHHAAYSGDIEKVRNILERQPTAVDATDNLGWKPIHYAARTGHLDIVKLLLDFKAEVDAKVEARTPDGPAGWTPLHLAAERGRVSVVKLLIERGANIEAKDVLNRTPLFLAAIEGQLEVVKLLVESKAEINVRDKYGRTPLSRVVDKELWDVARYLQEQGGTE